MREGGSAAGAGAAAGAGCGGGGSLLEASGAGWRGNLRGRPLPLFVSVGA